MFLTAVKNWFCKLQVS